MTEESTRSWRSRRCPKCYGVHPAGDFAVVSDYKAYWGWADKEASRRCPECGYEGPTSEFWVQNDTSRDKPKARTAPPPPVADHELWTYNCARCGHCVIPSALTISNDLRVHPDECPPSSLYNLFANAMQQTGAR